MLNTKHTPKSCGCHQCRFGASTPYGHSQRKSEEKSFRQKVRVSLKTMNDPEDVDVPSTLYGSYTD
jgi:hypothetical protein